MHKKIDEVKRIIKEKLASLHNIELSAFVGNKWKANNIRDIDLLVVVGDKNSLAMALKSLTESINGIKKIVAAKGISLGCYPTYKLKIIDYQMVNMENKEEKYLQLHLLVYRSFDILFRWEPFDMIKSFYETSNPIIGDRENIVKYLDSNRKTDISNLVQNYEYLIGSLIESYISAMLSEMPYEILVKDSLYRLNYVVRICCIEEIRNALTTINTTELNCWKELHQIGIEINNEVVKNLTGIIKIINSKEKISLNNLTQNMEKIIDLLDKRREGICRRFS